MLHSFSRSVDRGGRVPCLRAGPAASAGPNEHGLNAWSMAGVYRTGCPACQGHPCSDPRILAHVRKFGTPLNFTDMSPSNSTDSCIGFGPQCEDWLECGQAVSFQVTLTSRNEYLFSRPPVLDSNGTLSFTVRIIAAFALATLVLLQLLRSSCRAAHRVFRSLRVRSRQEARAAEGVSSISRLACRVSSSNQHLRSEQAKPCVPRSSSSLPSRADCAAPLRHCIPAHCFARRRRDRSRRC